MKTNFKRLFALVLTLCLLASLMVPVAFAEDVATESTSANVAETYPIRLKDLNATDPLTAEGLDALMVNTNASGVTSYKAPVLTASKLVDAYADGTLNWMFVETSNEVAYRSTDLAWQLRIKKGWGAFQIRVANGGLYALNLSMDKNTYETYTNNAIGWAGDISAYIIPVDVANAAIAGAVIPEVAEGETAPTAAQVAIPTLMTDEYSVGTATLAAEDTSATFAKTRMEAGEYVVVINNPQATNLPVSELSLLGDAYVMEEVASYALRPFDMTNTDPATYAGTINEQLASVTDGTATWAASLSVSKVLTSARYESLGVQYLTVSGSADMREYNLMQLRLKTAGNWVALKLNVANSGEQYLTLTSDKRASIEGFDYTNSYTDWAGDVTAYLLPLSSLAATDATTVGAAMTAENCIGTKTMLADDTSITFDKKYLEAGDYVLIYTADKGGYSVCEASLSKVAVEALPGNDKVTGTVGTYDFEIYELDRYAPMFTAADGTMSNRGYTNRTLSALEGVYEYDVSINPILVNDYEAGLLNYKYVGVGNGCAANVRGGDKLGVRIQKVATTEAAAGWVAYEIQVPTGGIYTVDLESEFGSNAAFSAYVLSADADIASSLTEENKVVSFAEKATSLNFSAEFATGANIVVFQLPETTEKVTIYLSSITLSVLEDTVTYDFGLSNDANFIAALREAVGDPTAEPLSNKTLKSWSYTVNDTAVEFVPYTTIATLFAEGKMNWALDASSGTYADTLQDDGTYKYSGSDMVNYRGGASLRLCMESEEISYAGLRIKVPTAGTYNITTSFTANVAADLYLFKAPNVYDAYGDRLYAGKTQGNTPLRDLIADAEPFASAADGVAVGTYTFEQSGEYVLAVVQPVVKSTNLYLTTMVMEPAEINYIADGAGYASFDEAVAAATESVVLLQDTTAGDVVVPAGVTLDLNGYNLDAASVDFAPAADIIDSADGKALLRVSGDITFNEDNAQLPLYNIDTNCYKLFNVDVVSSATTGSGSATKYWFKVNFSNAAAFDLIGSATELRIQADMSWVKEEVEGTAVATADAAFTNTWAANSDAYIVVTTTGEASGTGSSFELLPGITANGVVISGDAMRKN